MEMATCRVSVRVPAAFGRQTRARRGTTLLAAKKRPSNGDGGPEPPELPPRINPNSLVPVRRQIKYVKMLKQQQVERSAYRKKEREKEAYRKESQTPEERYQQKQLREKEAMELSKTESKSFGLRQLYQTNVNSSLNPRKNALRASRSPPILLVDGYNVCHVWSRTKDLIEAGELEEAREILVHQLEVYSIMNGVRVCVAFDAMGNQQSMNTSETLLDSGITVAYCGDREADTFLVSKAKEFVKRGATQVVVATNDSTLRVAIQSQQTDDPQICFTVTASGLINDMQRSEKQALANVADSGAPTLNLLACHIEDKNKHTFDKLQALRQGLLGKQP